MIYRRRKNKGRQKILSLDKGMRNGKPFGILFLIMTKDGYLILSPEISKRLFPDFDGIVWGRKTVDIPEQWEGKR